MLKIPQNINKIINVLESAGYEAYIVGGAVRDTLLDKNPDDFDITTSCPPEKVVNIFEKTIPTGIKHGTVTVLMDGKQSEVTTYRIDGEYSDNRAPDTVTFTGNLQDDLSRRDFTINAIAYNETKGLIDLFYGQKDIKNGIIKTVGDPFKRFEEDALRILRAVRFACQLGFNIEPDTYSAAVKLSYNLRSISGERIYTELCKALLSENNEVLEDFINKGGLKCIDVNSAKQFSLLKSLPKTPQIRFFAFLMLTDADFTKIAQKLKFSNVLCKNVQDLLKLTNFDSDFNRVQLKNMLNSTSPDAVLSYLKYLENVMGFDTSVAVNKLNSIIESKEPYTLSMLAINGDDIKSIGFSGKKIGEILAHLLEKCIQSPALNQKDTLISLIKKHYM